MYGRQYLSLPCGTRADAHRCDLRPVRSRVCASAPGVRQIRAVWGAHTGAVAGLCKPFRSCVRNGLAFNSPSPTCGMRAAELRAKGA